MKEFSVIESEKIFLFLFLNTSVNFSLVRLVLFYSEVTFWAQDGVTDFVFSHGECLSLWMHKWSQLYHFNPPNRCWCFALVGGSNRTKMNYLQPAFWEIQPDVSVKRQQKHYNERNPWSWLNHQSAMFTSWTSGSARSHYEMWNRHTFVYAFS